MTDDMHDLRVEFARRKGARAAEVLAATFDELGFDRHDADHRTEIARQIRATADTGNLAADLAAVANGVLVYFGHHPDPAEVRAAVTRHLVIRP
jgi:hypothetical protein